MEIMTNMSSAVDRIRDTTVSSSKGLQANLSEILTNFYKDDVLQPKPSPKLRLQEYYIKTLLIQLNIDKNLNAQLYLLDIIIAVNNLHLDKWVAKLETLTHTRAVLLSDINRFQNSLNSNQKWSQFFDFNTSTQPRPSVNQKRDGP